MIGMSAKRVRRAGLFAVLGFGMSVVSGCQTMPRPDSHREMSIDDVDARAAHGFILREQASDGSAPLKYAVYVPREYDAAAAAKWPCILFLHGMGESGSDGLKQIIQGLGSAIQWNAAEWPFVVILPQKPDARKQWEDYDDAVMSTLATTLSEYAIDADRVYLTGLSQGGHGTWAFATKHPGTFAAIAPICGYAGSLKPDAIAKDIGNVPVWAFHGLADDVVKPEETKKIMDAITSARKSVSGAAEVKASMYDGVNHGSWDRAYRNEKLAQWFLSHKRRSAPGK